MAHTNYYHTNLPVTLIGLFNVAIGSLHLFIYGGVRRSEVLGPYIVTPSKLDMCLRVVDVKVVKKATPRRTCGERRLDRVLKTC